MSRRRSWLSIAMALVMLITATAPAAADSELLGRVSGTGMAGLRLRAQPGFGQATLTVMPEGSTVTVSGDTILETGQVWRLVSFGRLSGWAASRYLQISEPLLSEEATSEEGEGDNPSPVSTCTDTSAEDGESTPSASLTPDSRATPSSRDGRPHGPSPEAIVDDALVLVGSPYRMGAAGPRAFDCAGLVRYVFGRHGVELQRDAASQWGYGTLVDRSELRAGDLVFFRNTYMWGISHVGIYIGNGQFVHAVDERTGVVISHLEDVYWSSHWHGARRMMP